ncbi:MAG: sterol desaturase family protein [Alphaproteobacteria bacterium]|nr:MAG: sterol desaturase family protein [Alphaproteobacteria bacterium]
METAIRTTGTMLPLIILSAMLLEAGWILYRRRQYPWREALASLGVNLIKRLLDAGLAGGALAMLYWVYEHRIQTLEIKGWLDGLVFFLSVEFAYYWHHRLSHQIRWFWATHSVHHSSNHMNLTSAGRLGWTGLISGHTLFYAPLVWLGYAPLLVVGTLALSLFYQFWLHTEVIGRLGPLERVFNTPSHHRVHHACNYQYIDRNFGGVLIIFDKLFGTFMPETEQPRYGLATPHRHLNPVRIAFHEWLKMVADVRAAERPWHRFLHMFGRPGWRPVAAPAANRPAPLPERPA